MLGVCRSLGRGGYDVTAASSTGFAAAQWSRSCTRRLRITDAGKDAHGFIEQLREELMRHSYATLIAGSDNSLLAVSRGRERLQGLTELGLPSASIVARALNRESLAAAAEQVGFVPAESIGCIGLEQASAAARQLGFPVVLKSRHAANVHNGACSGAPKSQVVSTGAELAERAPTFGDGLLVQRWAGHDLISFGGVIADGSLLGVAVSRYQRMFPPQGGSATFSETIQPPARLEDMVARLLTAIGWQGIFELELIQSWAGDFVPIDLNPRPYGSIALASVAGAPLATIWCDWLIRRSPQPAHAHPGNRYRWGDGDLRHLAWQLRRGRIKAAMGQLNPHRQVAQAHFERSDPLPLLARGLYLGKRLWSDEAPR
jgi:predicted ATP-grasp superfamily ATP-dependent carboligase